MSEVVVVLVAVAALVLLAWLPGVTAASPTVPVRSSATKCVVGNGPEFPAYDPVNHYVYVPNAHSSNISVLSGTCTHVASISLPSGAYPVYAAFDPQNDHMYVTDYILDQVYDIYGTKVVATVTGFDGPWGEAWDPETQYMVVANQGSNYVSFVIAPYLLFNVTVGSNPDFVGYDLRYSTLLVANCGSDSVTILSASNLSYLTSVPVGGCPGGVAYDPNDGLDYVANQATGNVSYLDGYGSVAGSIGGFKTPDGIAFNQANLRMYVANFGSGAGTVDQIAGLKVVGSNITVRHAEALGIAYDEYNNYMYVADFKANAVYILT